MRLKLVLLLIFHVLISGNELHLLQQINDLIKLSCKKPEFINKFGVQNCDLEELKTNETLFPMRLLCTAVKDTLENKCANNTNIDFNKIIDINSTSSIDFCSHVVQRNISESPSLNVNQLLRIIKNNKDECNRLCGNFGDILFKMCPFVVALNSKHQTNTPSIVDTPDEKSQNFSYASVNTFDNASQNNKIIKETTEFVTRINSTDNTLENNASNVTLKKTDNDRTSTDLVKKPFINDTETSEKKMLDTNNDQKEENNGLDTFDEAEDSHFLTYFMIISALCILFYVLMYNKKKILALMIEGRKRNVKRRPNSAAYRKLDCNLEEAMASSPSTSASNTLLY